MSTITIEPQKRRNGTYETASWFVTENILGKYLVGTDVLLSDLQDLSKSIKFGVYVSDDNNTYQHFGGFTWVGGSYLDKLGNISIGPGVLIDSAPLVNKYVKIIAVFDSPMRVGFYIEQAE
jgi:hypothetical protein